MSADIILLPRVRAERNEGNGAREALQAVLAETISPLGDVYADDILLRLSMRGFMLVPFGEDETK